MHLGLLKPPLQVVSCPDFPVVQYADDTLVLLQADAKQLYCLKALLSTFAEATRLKVNYSKSNLIPINISEDKVEIMVRTLIYKKGVFPITYLGMPLDCINLQWNNVFFWSIELQKSWWDCLHS